MNDYIILHQNEKFDQYAKQYPLSDNELTLAICSQNMYVIKYIIEFLNIDTISVIFKCAMGRHFIIMIKIIEHYDISQDMMTGTCDVFKYVLSTSDVVTVKNLRSLGWAITNYLPLEYNINTDILEFLILNDHTIDLNLVCIGIRKQNVRLFKTIIKSFFDRKIPICKDIFTMIIEWYSPQTVDNLGINRFYTDAEIHRLIHLKMWVALTYIVSRNLVHSVEIRNKIIASMIVSDRGDLVEIITYCHMKLSDAEIYNICKAIVTQNSCDIVMIITNYVTNHDTIVKLVEQLILVCDTNNVISELITNNVYIPSCFDIGALKSAFITENESLIMYYIYSVNVDLSSFKTQIYEFNDINIISMYEVQFGM